MAMGIEVLSCGDDEIEKGGGSMGCPLPVVDGKGTPLEFVCFEGSAMSKHSSPEPDSTYQDE